MIAPSVHLVEFHISAMSDLRLQHPEIGLNNPLPRDPEGGDNVNAIHQYNLVSSSVPISQD
jgi:hypothetical protein